jgi:putative N-acetylmannosamine-6-phosphate epimerase
MSNAILRKDCCIVIDPAENLINDGVKIKKDMEVDAHCVVMGISIIEPKKIVEHYCKP